MGDDFEKATDDPEPVGPAPTAGDVGTEIGESGQESTLDDPVSGKAGVGSGSACRPQICQLGERKGTWAGHENFECPLCGYATIDADAVRARNPNHQ